MFFGKFCRPRPRDDTISTLGIHRTCEQAVAVTFNVIVPQYFWLWDQQSLIHLRFGSTKLGGWNLDVGNFSVYK